MRPMRLVKPATEVTIAERDGCVVFVIGDEPFLKLPPDAADKIADAMHQKAQQCRDKEKAALKHHKIIIPFIPT